MNLIKRSISKPIKSLLSKYPILAITGPRQSGKTTLLKEVFTDYRYVSLENTDTRAFANEDPLGFLEKYDTRVIFDDVQCSPGLFPYLQTMVDESGQMGQFILSGSQNFHLLENITQSLAGRVALFKLLPFDISELDAESLLPEDWESLIIKGFYPAIYDRKLDPAVFYANYLQTYINRDVASLTNVQDTRRFQNFIRLCAARNGQLLNMSNLANECGISQPTAKSWLSILESSYLVFLLAPYYENFSKRIVKTPKLYFYDTGLAAFLLGLRSAEDFADRTLLGSLFEAMVIGDILKQNHHRYLLKEYWFWRDSVGHEIDLLTLSGGGFDIFEVKSTRTLLPNLFKGLDYFEKLAGDKVQSKTLIYSGEEGQERTEYKVRGWKG